MQDEGAAIMGLGHTLMEQYLFDDEGRIRNLGAIDYRIPTSMDLPEPARERVRRARRRPGAVRREGDERGRAAVRGAGGRLGDPGGDRGADPGPAALARSGSGGRSGTRKADAGAVTWVFASDAPPAGSRGGARLLLGGKAANLATMAVDLGLPVPPAFTISTEACRAYLASGWPDGLDDEVRAAMARLEARVGRRFGDAGGPAARLGPVRAPRGRCPG